MFGAIFGSFANVLIVRLPKGESLMTPSHCRGCNKQVGWANNIPIFSYLILRGRCRQCGERFSPRYLLVEILMATLFMWSYYRLGMTWLTFEFLIFVFGGVTASFIDIDHFILPDVFTLGGLALALIGAVVDPERTLLPALIGMLIGGGFLYLVGYAYFKLRGIDGMGGGDIKLMAWIGALMGWPAIPFVLAVACLAGAFFGIARFAIRRTSFREPMQFGPFIVFAALAYVLLDHQTMVQAFSSLIGLQSG